MALKFYRDLGELTSDPQRYNQATKAERKLIRDLRLRRLEFILGARLLDPNFIENFEVFMAQQVNFGPQRYLGPGTNLKKYVQTGALPKSKLDAAAFKHDLAYVYASTIKNKQQRREYVRAADHELLDKAERIKRNPKSSETDVLNANLTKRLLGDIKGNIEAYVDLGFEGVSQELTGPTSVKEFNKIVRDLQELNAIQPKPLYEQLYNEASQLQHQARYLNITHDVNYENFEEKFDLLKSDMSRRIQNPPPRGQKILPDPDEIEERKNAPPIVNPKLLDLRQQVGVLTKDVNFTEGAEAIIAQNEAVARSQERINIEPQVITGERILRLFTYRDTGLSVIPSDDAKTRNRVFLAKFSRVAEGAGDLGNNLDTLAGQVTKPIDNTLIRAWRHNQELRYAGKCFDGGAYIQPKKLPTEALLKKYRSSTIATTSTQQQMIPTQAVGYTRPGQKFPMMSGSNNRWVTPTQYRWDNRLVFPQLVDGIAT